MQTTLRQIAILAFFSIISAVFLHARGGAENKKPALTIYGIKGSSSVGLIRLFEEPPLIQGFDVKVEALAQQDLMAVRFIAGEAKAGILPPNMAAKIASSGVDIRALAVIGTGMLSLLSADPSVRGLEDLRRRAVEVAGRGATPDYVFRKVLASKGIDPDTDLTLGYSLAYPEIAQLLIAGRVSVALLPEPFASMALMGKPDLRSVADIQEEWAKAGGVGNYPMTLLVMDGVFASANAAAVDEIARAVKDSVEWVKAHPVEAGALAEKHELGIKAAVVAAAIPKSNYVYIPALEARPSLETLFKVFLEYSPVSIGSTLPGDRFYLK